MRVYETSWRIITYAKEVMFSLCLFVCLLPRNYPTDFHKIPWKVAHGPWNKPLDFGRYPDHNFTVVKRSQKFSPAADPLPGGAGRPKFNQLEMVISFTYGRSLVRIDACSFRAIVVTEPQTHNGQGFTSHPAGRTVLQLHKGRVQPLTTGYILPSFLLHSALASCGAVYCNRSCLWVCNGRAGGVCCHDNSELHASIFTKLGLQVQVVTISS